MSTARLPVHVVVGILRDASGRVLVTKRAASAHQGGKWEFPGGKRESGETRLAALERELAEEIGIEVLSARPFLRIRHDYAERRVLLDVWRVESWSGEPYGREQQVFEWVPPERLGSKRFPDADAPILRAVAELA